MVDYLESTLESLAQKLTTSYSVTDQSNTITSLEVVRNQLDYYKRKVKSEINKARDLVIIYYCDFQDETNLCQDRLLNFTVGTFFQIFPKIIPIG